MVSLRKRVILSFAISLGIFLIFVSVIIFSGLNAALKGWYQASEERYAASITRAVEKLYESSNGTHVSDDALIRAIEQYLNDRFHLLLISPDRGIIFSHNIEKPYIPLRSFQRYERRGNRHSEERSPEREERMGRRFLNELLTWATPIIINGEPKVFIWVQSIQFTDGDTINQRLVRNVIIILLLGIISSIAVAMIFTSIISGKITKEASIVSAGLEKIALGSRDVVFKESSLNEISSIGKSASILQETLDREEKARKQWTQDITHDLRTPVTAIKVQLEAMADGVLTPEKTRLEKLLTELNRLEILVEDVDRLTKIESEEITLSYADITSNDLIAILEERFGFQAQEKKIKLIATVDPFTINCDINNLTRALSNLVQNSIQYNSAGQDSEVNIRFYKEDNLAIFTIENKGNIPENEAEKIFDRLYRGEFGRSTKGSGLGLTIAKAAIEKHGGSISTYNKKDSVVFVIKIPVNKNFD
ncbi:MAG: HAMP domain-containing histidine kinase [Spirochaetaceae bacterium]|nr:HAMP domain-containing histidine kinase [Spirochaetaceae bacterium]